jgi:hypothetical protein
MALFRCSLAVDSTMTALCGALQTQAAMLQLCFVFLLLTLGVSTASVENMYDFAHSVVLLVACSSFVLNQGERGG